MNTYTMPAGQYYVGDLCYVLGDCWDEVCSLIIDGNNCLDGVFTLKDGTRFAIFSTAYGDGEYVDLDGLRYPVDAGSIGCVLVKDIDGERDSRFGNILDFYSDFECYSEGGNIHFGAVVIDTDPEYVDEEDEEDFFDELNDYEEEEDE